MEGSADPPEQGKPEQQTTPAKQSDLLSLQQHHGLMQEHHDQLLNHHYFMQDLYNSLLVGMAQDRDQALRDFHQALQEHHRMVRDHHQMVLEHHRMIHNYLHRIAGQEEP